MNLTSIQSGLAALFDILLVAIALGLARRSNIVRDQSTQAPAPYSLARTQLLWWSVIVLAMYVLVYAATGTLPQINTTCTILLGISMGTTASGSIVDTGDANTPNVVRHQDASPSECFFLDILSDQNGVSVHRFQLIAFNIVFGISFVVYVLQNLQGKDHFPTFDPSQLSLLGVSSAAYLSLKMNENRAGAGSTPPAPASGSSAIPSDELMDPEPSAAALDH